MEKIIGLMGAMPDEIAPLAGRMKGRAEEKIGGVTFTTGVIGGKRAVLCCAGMGKAQAAAAVQLLATHFGATHIVFSGIAGNVSGRVGVGDVIVGGEVVYHDGEPRMFAETYPHLQSFHCDEGMIAAALDACRACGVTAVRGKIATGDCFVGDRATKAAIVAKCAPDCVEMEGAAVAHIAAKNDLPCVILRAISDNADEAGFEKLVVKQFDVADYCETAARVSAALLERI